MPGALTLRRVFVVKVVSKLLRKYQQISFTNTERNLTLETAGVLLSESLPHPVVKSMSPTWSDSLEGAKQIGKISATIT